MRPIRVLVAVATLVLGVGVNRAHADTIRLSFDLFASGFRDVFGSAVAPVDPVRGSFSITFDNSTDLREHSTGVTVSGLNLAMDGPIGFAYGKEADVLIFGSLFNGAQSVVGGSNDFVFGINNISTNPAPVDFVYAQSSSDTNFLSRDVAITLTPTSTPEPATLALVGAGLTVAWLQRRRREGVRHQE